MRPMPAWGGLGVLGAAVLIFLGCASSAFFPGAGTPWPVVAVLAALYASCEQFPRYRARRGSATGGTGAFFPVLLTGVFLLPPAAAALVAAPAVLRPPAERCPGWPWRGWGAARLALACWAAAHAYGALCGRAALGGRQPRATETAYPLEPSPAPGALPDFPWLLVPAVAAVLVFCAVLSALDGGVTAAVTGPFPVRPAPVDAQRRVPPHTAWGGLFLRSLAPVAVHGLAGLLMAVLWQGGYGPLAALLVLLPMYLSYRMFAQYHCERAAHQATVRVLVQAVGFKDGYTRAHSERVGLASMMIARELGMDRERMETLRLAGVLHDVGKLGVPTRLLRKDGPLTAQERRLIELHPEYGDEMVRGIGFLGEARAAILHHHERVDGSGYPYGLTGHQIPECARVVAVADAFDAMTSTRSYRRARPVRAAVEELQRCAGAQFDPRMVRALVSALDRHGWHPTVLSLPDTPAHGGNVPPQRSAEAPALPRPVPAVPAKPDPAVEPAPPTSRGTERAS
jgi:putative nucleotidyltransferase with HDIG domain